MSQPDIFAGRKLDAGQFAVIFAESATGILLNLDKTRNLGTEIEYLVFNEFDEALEYAKNKVNNESDIECIIRNANFQSIVVIFQGKEPIWCDTQI